MDVSTRIAGGWTQGAAPVDNRDIQSSPDRSLLSERQCSAGQG